MLPLLALAAVTALYWQVLSFEYVWDDRAFFHTSVDLRTGDFWSVITAPVLAGTPYFRPAVMAQFAGEVRLAGGEPLLSHALNLVYHLANTSLLGLLVLRLRQAMGASRSQAWTVAGVGMLLYGLHPALIEGVAWVSGRFDLAVTFFSLTTLVILTSSTRWAPVAGAVAFLAALLSKEMAATVPVSLFLIWWALRRPAASFGAALRECLRGPQLLALLLLGVAACIYAALRVASIGSALQGDTTLQTMLGSSLAHLGYVGTTLAFYVRLAIWPFMDMGPLHPYNIQAVTMADTIAGVGIVLVAVALAIHAIVRPTRSRLLAVAALVSLLPVANILPLKILGNIGHERFMLYPLALAVLALCACDPPTWRMSALMRRRLPLFGIVALAAWSLLAILNLRVTLPLWRSDMALWSWAYAQHPESPMAQFSLAGTALRTKHYQVAEQVLKRSEADGPLPLRLSVPYAQLLVRTGKAVEGKQKLEATLATERQPHLDVLRAGVALEDARFLRDSYSDAWLLVYGFLTLAEAHNALREFPAGEQAAKIAHYYQPSNPVPVLYRSLAVYGQDKWDQAEVLFVKGKEMYAPAIRKEVDLVRTSFLTQLCSRPAEAPLVCGRFAKQADQAMAPPR